MTDRGPPPLVGDSPGGDRPHTPAVTMTSRSGDGPAQVMRPPDVDTLDVGTLDVDARAPSGEPVQTAPPAACLNCRATLAGPFCAACGQRDIPPYPSVRELAGDAFHELSGWDGRFAVTLRELMTKPGRLTLEFLHGRRARYLAPVRLYLVASLVYFVLAAAAPEVRLASGKALWFGVRVGVATGSGASASARPGSSIAAPAPQLDPAMLAAAKDSLLTEIAEAPELIQPFLRRAVVDPEGFRRGVFETMPRMLFALLPVFAGIVALFYRGRKYPEHLYFALHLSAFIFLALALIELLKFTRSPVIVISASIIVLATIPVYATVAFRRVYGGSLVRTLLKEVGIAAIYGVTWLAALIGLAYWVAVTG